MKTYQPKGSEIKREWHLIDLKDRVLGREVSKIIRLLIGKHKPNFSPHLDSGDYVVVINASQFKVTGKKKRDKIYYHHTNYAGGIKSLTLEELMAKDCRLVIQRAVKNMLPKNKLRKLRLMRLKIFKDQTHPYQDRLKKV